MVILNIYGKIKPTCISEKLKLFIGNLPCDWKSGLIEEYKNILEIRKLQNKRCESKKELTIKNLHSQIIQNSCLNANSTDIEYLAEIIDHMICIYFKYDYDDMPMGDWKTNPFDGRLCENDYTELIVNYWNEAYDKIMPTWIYSSNKETTDLLFRIFFPKIDLDIGIKFLISFGKVIDKFLQSRKDYLLLDYLIHNFQNDNENVYLLFIKWYSLCQLFLEKENENELDWKLPMFMPNKYSEDDCLTIAKLFRKIRNKIAHGDFLKLEELIEEFAAKIMDGRFDFDYSEKSRKNWAIDHACLLLKDIVKRMNALMFSNKELMIKIKNQKNPL